MTVTWAVDPEEGVVEGVLVVERCGCGDHPASDAEFAAGLVELGYAEFVVVVSG